MTHMTATVTLLYRDGNTENVTFAVNGEVVAFAMSVATGSVESAIPKCSQGELRQLKNWLEEPPLAVVAQKETADERKGNKRAMGEAERQSSVGRDGGPTGA